MAAAACGGDGGSDNDDTGPVDPPINTRPERCLEDPLSSGYCLVWQDEFSGDAIDSEKWTHERNCMGGGNNEAQCYVDDPENSWVAGDLLHIKAIRKDAVGPGVTDDDPNYDPDDTSASGTYTSARLRTKGLGDWKYGRFEMRAKLPQGQGTWPAFWMLPSEWVYGGWAGSGEIDIMEAVNLKVGGEDQIHGTLHYGGPWPGNVYSGEAYRLPGGINPADGFHEYAVEWEEGEIRWYLDGDHYATQTSDGWYSTTAPGNSNAPFDQAFHLILNFAVGGDWPSNVNDTGIDESVFPQQFEIDYVRVYQCTIDFATGKGCASTDGAFVHNPGLEAKRVASP
ncbi:glycoside hydrolase family 16 protein [Microbulbifer rhizosphaerae]|uniref:Beta-glucanase (GH16 family) n=1 Tax=Microbulbifer rhizosphaerae TaxID=1562603 RepID=A0A7W4WE34_9GAMM|nr:glycoside hydrolase family 16 protein [Microbulbifer rhizosphaerae]MBB3062017.1 beta-glucanase (GH16 family) [Microbulbifer rhizosphaerae]